MQDTIKTNFILYNNYYVIFNKRTIRGTTCLFFISVQTPDTKKKGPGSVGRGGGLDDPNEDAKSNASSSSSNKYPTSRTPKQVKAADAKKTKVIMGFFTKKFRLHYILLARNHF